MASLELIPKVPVLVVQGAVFLANIVIVKKLLVEPYLQVKDRRDKVTVGSKDDAVRFLAEAERVSQHIAERLQTAYDAAKAEREKIRAAALAKRDTIVSAAEKEAKAHMDVMERQVRDSLDQEKQKVPAIVKSLTDEVYRIALA